MTTLIQPGRTREVGILCEFLYLVHYLLFANIMFTSDYGIYPGLPDVLR
jgi:hypothetical protein